MMEHSGEIKQMYGENSKMWDTWSPITDFVLLSHNICVSQRNSTTPKNADG